MIAVIAVLMGAPTGLVIARYCRTWGHAIFFGASLAMAFMVLLVLVLLVVALAGGRNLPRNFWPAIAVALCLLAATNGIAAALVCRLLDWARRSATRYW